MRALHPAKAGLVIGLALLLVADRHATGQVPMEKADRGLALPPWEDSEGVGVLGGGLWPDDFNPSLIIHPATIAQSEDAPVEAEEDSWLRFLPRSLFSNRKPQPAVEPALADISAEALRAGENAPADARVIDPQGILDEAQTEDLTRLLAFHSETASVEARFLLLDAGQQLPPGTDLSRMASGELVRGSACLVVYPLAAPGRARIFLTGNVTRAVDATYLEALAAACRRDAAEARDAVEQLQRFATQLSIRLFWLERAYPAVKPEPVATVPAPPAPPPQVSVPTLSEIAVPLPPPSWTRFPMRAVLGEWQPWMGAGLAGLLVIALVTIMLVRWNRRRRSQTVWLLPDYDHRRPVRFGGPHCGGCGASVKYG